MCSNVEEDIQFPVSSEHRTCTGGTSVISLCHAASNKQLSCGSMVQSFQKASLLVLMLISH